MTNIGAFVVVALLLPLAHADVYLHNPKGSNNRLNENKRDRKEANRLFDSQNNKRGGYNKGGGKEDDANENNEDLPMQFVAGSKLPIEWTSQHECGQENTKCEIILQYMCDPNLRDGTSTGKIDDDKLDDSKEDKGRHESPEYYRNCEARQRNKGLFLADQDLDGNSAKYTRQNPNGQRSGLECPEERDYYPYWAPTPWRDIAVFTNDNTRCAEIRRESQNVKAKPFCAFKTEQALKDGKSSSKQAPLTQAECDQLENDGKDYGWTTAPAHGLPAPDCLPAPKARDNHNGNGQSEGREGTSARIPQTLNFMWTVPDTPAAGCALRIRYNISVLDYNPTTTFADAEINIKGQYGINGNDDRGYVFENNPVIKPLEVDGNVEDDLKLELAINTAQTGRCFQDRTHKFQIVKRDSSIPASATIHNLNIRGRRGNIVQVYPAVEYDFVPNVLQAKRGDYIHPQWTGALTLPKDDDGEGEEGTDKNNMILLTPKPFGGSENTNKFADGYPTTNYLQKIDDSGNRIMGLDKDTAERAAVPKEGDAPPDYFQNPCPSTKKDELIEKLDDELETLTSLLDETISKLHKKHERTRRSITAEELADLDNLDSHLDMAEKDKEIDDGKETKEDDEDEDVGENDEVSNDARRSRRSRRSSSSSSSSSRSRRSSSSSGSSSSSTPATSSPLIALDQNYACKANEKRTSNGGRRRRNRFTLLNDSPAYVDIGPQKAEDTGTWEYMCTRNNNFSNRSQKGTIIVSR